jgi:hypothetical protein
MVPGVTSRCIRRLLGKGRISVAKTARSAQFSPGRRWVLQHGDLVLQHQQLRVLGGR